MITPKFRRSKRTRRSAHAQQSRRSGDIDGRGENVFSSLQFGSAFFPPRSTTSFHWDKAAIIDSIQQNAGEDLKVANFNLRRALGLLKLNDSYHKLEFIESFIFSATFKMIGFILTAIQCAFCLLEPVSVSSIHSESHPLCIAMIPMIEIMILVFHALTIAAHIYRKETVRNVAWIWWVMTMLLLLSVVSVLISLCLDWNVWFRFHRMIRPLFFNLYWMHGLWCFEIITMTLIQIARPFALALVSITIFSAVVYSMFSPHSLSIHGDPAMRELHKVGLPQFSSFGRTWIEMFVLQTSGYVPCLNIKGKQLSYQLFVCLSSFHALSTYPDIIAEIYRRGKNYCIIFHIYMVVQFLLITNLFLCVVCEDNKKIFGAKITYRYQQSLEILQETWTLLTSGGHDDKKDFTMSRGGDQMSKLQFLKLLHFTDDYGNGTLDAVKKEIIWHTISVYDPLTRLRYLSQSGFERSVPWMLGSCIRLQNETDEHGFVKFCRDVVECNVSIFGHSNNIGVLGLIFDIITMTQCVLTFLRISTNHHQWEMGMALAVIDYIWIIDIVIRLCGTHWGQYCRSRHLINGVITMIVLAVNVVDLCYPHITLERLDDSIELLRLFSVGGAVLKLTAPNRLYSVVNAMCYAMRASAPIVIQMAFVMYSFAVLGMDIFGAIKFEEIESELTDHYLWGSPMVHNESWQSFNFHSFQNAMHMMFVNVIANNWHVFMFGYADILQSQRMYGEYGDVVSYLYFTTLIIVLPSIGVSIVIAVLLDMYDSYGAHQENVDDDTKEDEKDQIDGGNEDDNLESKCPSDNKALMRKFTEEILQKSADELYPHQQYTVKCLSIRFNHFYELPPEYRIKGVKYWIS